MTVRYLWSCCDAVVNEVADGHCDAVMELVIVSQNYQFQHYTHFHEAKIKSSRTGRGQMLEAESEAKDKSSRPRPRPRTKFWPRGQLGLEDLTSLV